ITQGEILSVPIHLDRPTNLGHRLLRFEACAARAFLDQRYHLPRIITKLTAALADRAVALDDRIGQRAFTIYTTDAGVTALVIETIRLLGRQEEPVHLAYIAVLGMTRIGPLDARSIGNHHPRLLAHDS